MNINQVSVVSNTSLQQNTARNNMLNENLPNSEKRYKSAPDSEKVTAGLPSLDELAKAVEETNKVIQSVRKNLKFGVHEDTSRVFVEVRDTDTDEVIKELPPKEFLDMVAKIREYVGLMVDEKI